MQAINRGEIEKLLSRPWTVDNQTFRARCWTDKTKLVETVNQELTRMIATGEAPDKAIEAISKRFNVSKQNAGRVVMTESAYFATAAQKDCFEDLGVEKYTIVAALDSHTCETCGDLDSQVFKMSDYQVGATAPPFHPWCRCCTAPYFEDMEGLGDRYARDAETGKRYKVPKNTTYKDWKAQQDAAHGTGTVDKVRKMHYNESADYYRYKQNNPNSNKGLYNANKVIKELRAAGAIRAKGTVTAAPKGWRVVECNTHAYEDMEKRGITIETAQGFIDKAVFALKQRKGTQYAFYTSEGYAVLDNDGMLTSVGWLDEGGKILYKKVMRYAGSSK